MLVGRYYYICKTCGLSEPEFYCKVEKEGHRKFYCYTEMGPARWPLEFPLFSVYRSHTFVHVSDIP